MATASELAWVKVDDYVWCDRHGAIHGHTTDPYDVGGGDDCTPDVWRPVYVLGDQSDQP